MTENFSSVELQSYYSNLGKKEKSVFLKFMVREFDYSYSSIQQKMTGQANLNARDIILIGETVKSESWKS